MKKLFVIACFVLSLSAAGWTEEPAVSAAVQDEASVSEDVATEEPIAEEPYLFPHIDPRFFVSGGYRFISLRGSSRAEEYEYLHDSFLVQWGERIFTFPHRLHLDIDVKNGKDYYGELDYAYKDLVVAKVLGRSIFHNLDTIDLIDLEPDSPTFSLDVRDRGGRYGISSDTVDLFLRFKAPEYPFHVYFDWKHFDRSGHRQQRALLGSALFNNLVKSTQNRDVDWKTEIVTLGANSHLGPVEVDFSHMEKRFDAKGSSVLYDAYDAAALNPQLPPVREAGTYPHNAIPDLKGSADTLKLHTSYTGGLVGTATFSSLRRENQDSGAKVDYYLGAGEVIWIPAARTAVFLRYRHKETDSDSPATVSITDLSNPANSYRYSVRHAISSESDTVNSAIRYRLSQAVILRAEYSYDHVRRSHEDPWMIPDSTERHTVALSADARIKKGLTLKARYLHREADNPAYNSEPDSHDEGKISATWIPVKNVSTLLSYSLSHQKRTHLMFFDAEDKLVNGPDLREVDQDRLLGSATVVLTKDLSLTGSYMLMHYKVKQDIVYRSSVSQTEYLTETGLPHRDTSQHVSVDLSYIPRKHISLSTGISHTNSKGTFGSISQSFSDASAIDELTDIKIRETVFSFTGEYRFTNGFETGFGYKYADFDDVYDNPHDDIEDGHAHVILLKLSKRW